jgi:hypothetical protein
MLTYESNDELQNQCRCPKKIHVSIQTKRKDDYIDDDDCDSMITMTMTATTTTTTTTGHGIRASLSIFLSKFPCQL